MSWRLRRSLLRFEIAAASVLPAFAACLWLAAGGLSNDRLIGHDSPDILGLPGVLVADLVGAVLLVVGWVWMWRIYHAAAATQVERVPWRRSKALEPGWLDQVRPSAGAIAFGVGLAVLLAVVGLVVASVPAVARMIRDEGAILGVPVQVMLFGAAIVLAAIGFIWMWRITDFGAGPERMVWRSADAGSSFREVRLLVAAVASGGVAVAAVVALSALPVDAPQLRIRTIVAAVLDVAVLLVALGALWWIALSALFGDDDR